MFVAPARCVSSVDCFVGLDCETTSVSLWRCTLVVCSYIGSMGPGRFTVSILSTTAPVYQQRIRQTLVPLALPRSYTCPVADREVHTFLSHFALAFAQWTHAIGMRSVDESIVPSVGVGRVRHVDASWPVLGTLDRCVPLCPGQQCLPQSPRSSYTRTRRVRSSRSINSSTEATCVEEQQQQ